MNKSELIKLIKDAAKDDSPAALKIKKAKLKLK